MTTARITSLSPQVYASTLRAAQEVKQQESAPRHSTGVQAEPGTARASASEGSAKMPGVGEIVDVVT
jgi:hypothetical protein